MKDFILTPGYAFNPAHISHVKIERDGSIMIHVGSSALQFTGEEGAKLRKLFAPDETAAEAEAAKAKKAKAE